MKELSIEEKAKRYDEALERAKSMMALPDDKAMIEEIFPELKESEDERIRKEIIELVMQPTWKTEKEFHRRNEICAWLEKQGEHKKFRNSIQVGDRVTRNEDGILVNLSQLNRVAKPADKVEPKFHEGDWVVNNTTFNLCHILKVEHGQYVCDDCSFPITKENEYHLWTIEDAKDGDVLVFKNNICGIIICKSSTDYDTISYCRLVSDNLINKEESGWDSTLLVPATKEQRDLLFQKMKEAGYEWDADKKELKKIEQKPAWSEEDERMLENAISSINHDSVIEGLKSRGISYSIDSSTYLMENLITWLKNLKDRVQPQPKREWSEDDSVMIDNVLGTYKTLEDMLDLTTCQDKDILESMNFERDWIKSLKYRTQPKQEWNKEEQQIIEDAACIILDCLDCVNTVEIKKEEERLVELADKLQNLKSQNTWKPSDEHYELEEFAKIVRGNLTGISEAVQELFEAKYLQLTGNKMYGGFKD